MLACSECRSEATRTSLLKPDAIRAPWMPPTSDSEIGLERSGSGRCASLLVVARLHWKNQDMSELRAKSALRRVAGARRIAVVVALASLVVLVGLPRTAGAQVPQPPLNGNCEGAAVVVKLSVVEDRAAANMLAEAATALALGERCLVDAGDPRAGTDPAGSRGELGNANRVFVVGGPAAISDSWLRSQLGVSSFTRVAGGNRWATQSAVAAAIVSLARGEAIPAYRGQPGSSPDLPPNTGCTNAVLVKLSVVEDRAAANMLAETFNHLSANGDDRCLIDVGDERSGTMPSSQARREAAMSANQFVVGGTAAISDAWLDAHFGSGAYDRIAGADRWATQAAVANRIINLAGGGLAGTVEGHDIAEHVTASGEHVVGERTGPLWEDVTLYVFWCGERSAYDEAVHRAEVAGIGEGIKKSILMSQLDGAGFSLRLEAAGALFPSDVDWPEKSISQWWRESSGDNECIVALDEHIENLGETPRDDVSRRNSFILADVAVGRYWDPERQAHVHVSGFAWGGQGPAVMPTLRMFTAPGHPAHLHAVVFAHEFGHSVYDLDHVWGDSNTPKCEGLSDHESESVMSYSECGRRDRIETSYIACRQLRDELRVEVDEGCDARPPPVAAPEPVDSPVTLSVGASAQGAIGVEGPCTSVHCRWLRIEVDRAAVERRIGPGPYTVVCAHETFEKHGRGAYRSAPVTSFPVEDVCFFGYPGVEVYAIVGARREGGQWVGGLRSNAVVWPDCSREPGRCADAGTSQSLVTISWGTDGTNRIGARSGRPLCPSGHTCTNLSYEISPRLGAGPWTLTCGVGNAPFDTFLWSGNPETGCLFAGNSGDAWVEVNGHRSNHLQLSTRGGSQAPPPQLRSADGSIGVRLGASAGYDIQYRRIGSSSWMAWHAQDYVRVAGDGIWTYITGLNNGTTYEVRIRPQAHVGSTGWSTPQSATPQVNPAEPTLTVRRGNTVVIEDGNCGVQAGCRWVLGSGSGWPPGEQFWIRCGSGVDTSKNKPVQYRDRFVDSNGNLSWGPGICASAASHTVEVWSSSGIRKFITIQ